MAPKTRKKRTRKMVNDTSSKKPKVRSNTPCPPHVLARIAHYLQLDNAGATLSSLLLLSKESYEIVAPHLYRDVYISSKGFGSLFSGLYTIRHVPRSQHNKREISPDSQPFVRKWTPEEKIEMQKIMKMDRKESENLLEEFLTSYKDRKQVTPVWAMKDNKQLRRSNRGRMDDDPLLVGLLEEEHKRDKLYWKKIKARQREDFNEDGSRKANWDWGKNWRIDSDSDSGPEEDEDEGRPDSKVNVSSPQQCRRYILTQAMRAAPLEHPIHQDSYPNPTSNRRKRDLLRLSQRLVIVDALAAGQSDIPLNFELLQLSDVHPMLLAFVERVAYIFSVTNSMVANLNLPAKRSREFTGSTKNDPDLEALPAPLGEESDVFRLSSAIGRLVGPRVKESCVNCHPTTQTTHVYNYVGDIIDFGSTLVYGIAMNVLWAMLDDSRARMTFHNVCHEAPLVPRVDNVQYRFVDCRLCHPTGESNQNRSSMRVDQITAILDEGEDDVADFGSTFNHIDGVQLVDVGKYEGWTKAAHIEDMEEEMIQDWCRDLWSTSDSNFCSGKHKGKIKFARSEDLDECNFCAGLNLGYEAGVAVPSIRTDDNST